MFANHLKHIRLAHDDLFDVGWDAVGQQVKTVTLLCILNDAKSGNEGANQSLSRVEVLNTVFDSRQVRCIDFGCCCEITLC